VLGGLTIHLPVANFLLFIYAKNYENWLEVDKVIATISRIAFWSILYISMIATNQRRKVHKISMVKSHPPLSCLINVASENKMSIFYSVSFSVYSINIFRVPRQLSL